MENRMMLLHDWSNSLVQFAAENGINELPTAGEIVNGGVSWQPTTISENLLPDLEIVELPVMAHIITLTKQSGRALNDEKSTLQIQSCIDAVTTQERTKRGWSIGFAADDDTTKRFTFVENKLGKLYSVDVSAVCRPSKMRKTFAQEFENICAMLDSKAQIPANRWKVSHVDGETYVPHEVQQLTADPNEDIGYAPFEVPDDEEWIAKFDGLYGLDDYVEIIRSTLESAADTHFMKRTNIVLQGPPACGKSEICKRLKRLLGAEAVLEFDATSTTMAGAQQELSTREELPRVLIVEEIEKAPEASLQWLLSVLDLRGEIRKTTARGNILKEVHMVGIATCNDVALFDKLSAGALSSRFSMPLEMFRPTREIKARILKREVDETGGNIAWIEPTLDFCEQMGGTFDDPRKMISVMLTGRDKLLDGSYQKMLRRTSPVKNRTIVNSTPVQADDAAK